METYTQPNNDSVNFTVESYAQPNNDSVDFHSVESTPTPTEPPSDGGEIDIGPIEFPESVDLPIGTVSIQRMNTGVAIFLGVILSSILFGAIKLRSMVVMFGWMLTIVVLLACVFTDLQLLWFWLVVIVDALLLSLASISYARASARNS